MRQTLCFKHRRRVARDNTVKYHRHTLQLLPSQQRRSYAGAAVVVLEGLDGRLSLQHEGRIIASQDAPPSTGFLRNGNENSNNGFTLTRYSQPSVESKTTAPQALTTLPADERFEGLGANNGDVDGLQVIASPGKPTFLQTERWKAVQQAKLEGMSIRGMARELGIHRDTVRRYIDADSPVDVLRFGHLLTVQRICHPYEGCKVESAGTGQDPSAQLRSGIPASHCPGCRDHGS